MIIARYHATRKRWGQSGLLALCLLMLFAAPSLGVEHPDTASAPKAEVRITGKVGQPLVLTETDISLLPQKSIDVSDDHGVHANYRGVALASLLDRAKAPLGKDLRGRAMRLYLVVHAADGYEAVFALPELDPAFTDKVVLLVNGRDGHPLSAEEGPFRIIVPDEKRHARWVRQVTTLAIEEAQ